MEKDTKQIKVKVGSQRKFCIEENINGAYICPADDVYSQIVF